MPESVSPCFGPPVARVIPLSDFSQASALFTKWRGQFEQISSGRFQGKLRIVRGELVRIIVVEANQRVLIRGHDVAGLFSVYPVTNGNAESVWQGRRLTPGQLVVHGADGETEHFSARRTETMGASLCPETLKEAAKALLSIDVVPLPQTWTTLSQSPEGFAGLNRQLFRLLNLGVTDPSLLGTPEGHALEQECVRSLVDSLFSTTPHVRLSLPARSWLLRRAEELMRSRLRDPIGAIDLCRELDISDRTLRLAFRERYAIGPMAYYRCLRLNAVRSRLRANPPVAISDAAREVGFHHLGNFAADYRRLFGERPSETSKG